MQYYFDLSPHTNIYQTTFFFLCIHLRAVYVTFLVILTLFTHLSQPPLPKKLALTILLHSGICEKQTSVRSLCQRRRRPQAQVGTVLSASACDPRERTSPHHLTHQLTARTTAMTTCSIATTVALVTCSLATAIALSNRQVTWAGHTLTALTLPHPHLLLLLPLQTGLRSLEERIPHLGKRFE